MANKQRFYDRRLQRYFDKKFKQYEDSVEWFDNHAPNELRFYIPELNQIVTLICGPSTGEIVENVRACKDLEFDTGPVYLFEQNPYNVTRECYICGKEFKPKSKGQKYCCDYCRKTAQMEKASKE